MKWSITNIKLLAGVILSLLVSCSNDEKGNNYSYFISLEENLTLSQAYITSFIGAASASYPDLNQISGYFSGGVIVSTLTYKTMVAGEEISASGLVSRPDQPGEYPVLCFMNGTNTLNSLCPTNSVLNPQYQMLEILASMGYVVVVPDYPGFGASSEITHPYLVAQPTVTSTVDMLYALKEAENEGLGGVMLRNEYYVMGYSQGGWAAMSLHKALELDYSDDFILAGSVCGAGPYDINYIFQNMTGGTDYPMPVYIGYIVNAYSQYNQFTNPVTDLLNQPYAGRLPALYNGSNDFTEINSQLTTSVSGLLVSGFLSGFSTDPKYETVRNAMTMNSIAPYHTLKPLFLVHGGGDTQVTPLVTDHFYTRMVEAGTSETTIRKLILPGLDHGDGVVPAMIEGLKFLRSISVK